MSNDTSNILTNSIKDGKLEENYYTNLKSYYKRNLVKIDQLLPYYLKSLEVLAQHYTIPVALSRSLNTAPDVFTVVTAKLESSLLNPTEDI